MLVDSRSVAGRHPAMLGALDLEGDACLAQQRGERATCVCTLDRSSERCVVHVLGVGADRHLRPDDLVPFAFHLVHDDPAGDVEPRRRCAVDIDRQKAEATADAIMARNAGAHAIQADVGDVRNIDRMVQALALSARSTSC